MSPLANKVYDWNPTSYQSTDLGAFLESSSHLYSDQTPMPRTSNIPLHLPVPHPQPQSQVPIPLDLPPPNSIIDLVPAQHRSFTNPTTVGNAHNVYQHGSQPNPWWRLRTGTFYVDDHSKHITPWSRQESLLELYCGGRLVTPQLHAVPVEGIDVCAKGWFCYRRNFFSVNCHFELNPVFDQQQLHVLVGGNFKRVQATGMRLQAVYEGVSEKREMVLVQFTTLREKGLKYLLKEFKAVAIDDSVRRMLPAEVRDRPGERLKFPPPLAGFSLPLQYLPEEKPDIYVDEEAERGKRNKSKQKGSQKEPSKHQRQPQQEPKQPQAQPPAAETAESLPAPEPKPAPEWEPEPTNSGIRQFHHLQFNRATRNNGERKPNQEYFRLILELVVDVRENASAPPEWVACARHYSQPLTVRGRSPSHFNANILLRPLDLPLAHYSNVTSLRFKETTPSSADSQVSTKGKGNNTSRRASREDQSRPPNNKRESRSTSHGNMAPTASLTHPGVLDGLAGNELVESATLSLAGRIGHIHNDPIARQPILRADNYYQHPYAQHINTHTAPLGLLHVDHDGLDVGVAVYPQTRPIQTLPSLSGDGNFYTRNQSIPDYGPIYTHSLDPTTISHTSSISPTQFEREDKTSQHTHHHLHVHGLKRWKGD